MNACTVQSKHVLLHFDKRTIVRRKTVVYEPVEVTDGQCAAAFAAAASALIAEAFRGARSPKGRG